MSSKITVILDVLGDGKWHETGELEQQAKLDGRQVQEVIRFLGEFDFVKIDSPRKKVRMCEGCQELMSQTLT